jgi:hypothetical protein
VLIAAENRELELIEQRLKSATETESLQRKKEIFMERKKVHEDRKEEYEKIRLWVEERFNISQDRRTFLKKKEQKNET